jgi:hypothetical protein
MKIRPCQTQFSLKSDCQPDDNPWQNVVVVLPPTELAERCYMFPIVLVGLHMITLRGQ